MHHKLAEWLLAFDKDVQENSGYLIPGLSKCPECPAKPTVIYNSLVMLGIERPNSPCMDRHLSYALGCDCLTIIADEIKDIESACESIQFWTRHNDKGTPEGIARGNERIVKDRESIELYTAMHSTHADFNRRVHWVLRNAGAGVLAKVRAVCLRDLRDSSEGGGIVTNPSYGRELATFLIHDPKGWW